MVNISRNSILRCVLLIVKLQKAHWILQTDLTNRQTTVLGFFSCTWKKWSNLLYLKTTISLIHADVPIQRTLSMHINLQNFTPKEISKTQQPPPQLSTSTYTVDHINYNPQSTLTTATQHLLNSSLKKEIKNGQKIVGRSSQDGEQHGHRNGHIITGTYSFLGTARHWSLLLPTKSPLFHSNNSNHKRKGTKVIINLYS